jgi:hypothetical protein
MKTTNRKRIVKFNFESWHTQKPLSPRDHMVLAVWDGGGGGGLENNVIDIGHDLLIYWSTSTLS